MDVFNKAASAADSVAHLLPRGQGMSFPGRFALRMRGGIDLEQTQRIS